MAVDYENSLLRKIAEGKRKTIHLLDYQERGYFQGLKSGKDLFENVRGVLRHIPAQSYAR
jgi:hypothetical protein